MRLLFIPVYTSPHILQTDTTFWYAKLFATTVVNRRDCMLYVTVPDDPETAEFVKQHLDVHPRIRLIPVPCHKNQNRELVYVPEALIARFSEMEGDLYLDAVLTDKLVMMPYLQNLLHTWSTNGMGKITMGWSCRFFLRENDHAYSPKHYQKSEIFGLALADRCYWSAPNVLHDALEMARKYVSPAEFKAIRDKSVVAYSPVEFSALDAFQAERDPTNPARVINYAYALTAGYNMPKTFEMLDYLFARGNRDVRILVTSSSKGFGVTQLPEHILKYVDVHFGLPQHEFWRKISTAHAFVHMPNYCELSASVVEQQYLGLVGVMPDKPWARDLVYKGYPFLSRTPKEAAGMLRYILDKYFTPEIQDVIARQRDYLLEHFDGQKLALKIYDDLARAVGTGLPGSRGTLPQLFAELFKDIPVGGEVSFDDWRERIKTKTRIKYDVAEMPLAMHGLSKNRFRKVMFEIGFRDRFDHDLPHFERVALYDPAEEPPPKQGILRIPDNVPLPGPSVEQSPAWPELVET